jgi:FAD/FMN-containing dehydrogenase/Fe-S oxidoreductase
VDERRARIYDDLRGIVLGDLYFEPLDRMSYAHDASLYEIDPLGVIVPRNEDDVVSVVRYAAENGIPLHVRGAGTDTGGGSLGPGLIVDVSRHLRKIIAIGPDHVVVEPGVVLDVLNAQLAPLGRRLEPIPSDSDVTTVGGMIGVDAAGPRSMRYGSIGDQVDRLRVVFAQGEVADLGFEPWPEFEAEPSDFKDLIVRKLQTLFKRSRARFERLAPAVTRNRAGYGLLRSASERGIQLGRLMAGSEGTLAIVLQAALRTVPLPVSQGVVLLPFVGLADAAAFVTELAHPAMEASSCDLFDRRSVSLVRDADPFCHAWIDEGAETILTVEFEGDDLDVVAAKVRLVAERAKRTRALVSEPFSTFKRPECDRLLGLRRLLEPLLMRFRGPARPISFIDDVAVPPDRLAPVLQRLQSLLRQQNITWTFDAYAGEGRLRIRPFLDLSDPGDRDRLEPLASSVYSIVIEAGGTISSASGCGLVRTQFLRKQYGELVQVFREIKDAFDPEDQLNPGKVIGDDPHLMLRDLKRWPPPDAPAIIDPPSSQVTAFGHASRELSAGNGAVQPETERRPAAAVPWEASSSEATAGSPLETAAIEPALRWPGLSLVETASACQGCGSCRSLEPTARMCPSFRSLRREAATPRSQANLVRMLATGQIDPRLWGDDEFKEHADLCIHCKMCRTECPRGVDVSSLMLEAKAAYVEKHGLPPGDWIFSRIELWAELSSRFPIVATALLARPRARWLLERLLGTSRHRLLPRMRRTPFTRRAARLGLSKPRPQLPGPRVVYFVDIFANYYDQELAESVVAVLHHAEVNVYVPQRQRNSGLAALIAGDVNHARDQALANLRVLANAVRDGYTVVCSEPTAALMLREEYVKLTEDLDAELVAANTMDVGQYLLGLDARGQLPRPRAPLHARVGYHQPCHLRALNVGSPGLDLLRNVLELEVEFINRGCSGMGGTFGLQSDRYWASRRAGRGLIKRLRDADIDIGATECGACRIQMEQGVAKRTLHPIKLLSLGYGLNPSLRQHFKDPKPRHVLS